MGKWVRFKRKTAKNKHFLIMRRFVMFWIFLDCENEYFTDCLQEEVRINYIKCMEWHLDDNHSTVSIKKKCILQKKTFLFQFDCILAKTIVVQIWNIYKLDILILKKLPNFVLNLHGKKKLNMLVYCWHFIILFLDMC